MSDVSQGPGWWQASDGKWYPPESAPGYQQPAPVYQQPAAPAPTYMPPGPTAGPPQKEGMNGCLKALLIALGICAVLALIIGGCTLLIADDVKEAFDEAIEEAEQAIEEAEQAAEDAAEDAAEIADEATEELDDADIGGSTGDADIGEAVALDADIECTTGSVGGIELSFTSPLEQLSDFDITVDFLDDEGGPAGQQRFKIETVNPGEQVVERFESPNASAATCEAPAVRTTDSDATIDPDALSDIGDCSATVDSASVVPIADVTNSSTQAVDYEVVAAVIDQNGARRGLSVAEATGVAPGTTESLVFSSNILALATGDFTCEIRSITRTR